MGSRDVLLICALVALVAGVVSVVVTPAWSSGPAPAARPRAAPIEDDVSPVAQRVDDALGGGPRPKADSLLVARRLSLGLAGTVPSLEDVRALERVPEARRVDVWTDRVLSDPRHPSYLAERLSRALVGTKAGPFLVYRRHRFVSWLEGELAANRPYDAIARQIVTAEGLWTDSPATNFVTATIVLEEREGRPDEAELAGRVSRAFLAKRIDCAQCHDHPFAKWTNDDFKGLAAFFSGARSTFGGIHEEPRAGDPAPRVPFSPELLPPHGTSRARLATWMTDPKNRAFSRAAANRAWALLFGAPLVSPIDDIRDDTPAPPALDVLAGDFSAHGFDLRRLFRVIAATSAFQDAAFPVTPLRPEQLAGAILQAGSVETVTHHHPLERLGAASRQGTFIARWGDAGDEEMSRVDAATVAQHLLLSNGDLVADASRDRPLRNAAAQIAVMARDDDEALDAIYLATLTRRPSPAERAHFRAKLSAHPSGSGRREAMGDIAWTLINSTEVSCNH